MSVREDVADRIPGGDTGLIVAVLLVIYAAYVLAGVGLGFSLRGQLNTIATLTFFIGVFAILSLALNLHWGYTGLFNIGIVGFMAVGIYVMALVSKPLYQAGGAAQVGGLGLPIVVGMLAGVAAAALLGLVVALPALRLRADYLAIVTIAMSEIVRFSFLSGELQQFQPGEVIILDTDGWTQDRLFRLQDVLTDPQLEPIRRDIRMRRGEI